MSVGKERYEKLDGLRAFAAIGIVMMHVLSNGGYEINGFLFERMIPSFTDFVFLFMVISAFSMCCGYYEKVLNAQITPSEFYKKRFQKVLPFFAILCILDFCLSPSVASAYEVFANLTLCFGLLPNANISVIGVGWFLGLTFVFYFLFPFYCTLLETKKKAWLTFAVSLVFHYLCIVRFNAGRSNIMYCAVYFVAGGMIYLYRDILRNVAERFWLLLIIFAIVFATMYYRVDMKTIPILLFCVITLVIALRHKSGNSVLTNPIVSFISGISMEIYLCHMVSFRGLELFGLTHLFESDVLSYILCCIGTVLGAIAFSVITQKGIEKVRKYMFVEREYV